MIQLPTVAWETPGDLGPVPNVSLRPCSDGPSGPVWEWPQIARRRPVEMGGKTGLKSYLLFGGLSIVGAVPDRSSDCLDSWSSDAGVFPPEEVSGHCVDGYFPGRSKQEAEFVHLPNCLFRGQPFSGHCGHLIMTLDSMV